MRFRRPERWFKDSVDSLLTKVRDFVCSTNRSAGDPMGFVSRGVAPSTRWWLWWIRRHRDQAGQRDRVSPPRTSAWSRSGRRWNNWSPSRTTSPCWQWTSSSRARPFPWPKRHLRRSARHACPTARAVCPTDSYQWARPPCRPMRSRRDAAEAAEPSAEVYPTLVDFGRAAPQHWYGELVVHNTGAFPRRWMRWMSREVGRIGASELGAERPRP